MNIEKEITKEEEHQLHISLKSYFTKFKGDTKPDSTIELSDNIIAAVGGLIAISIISALAVPFGFPMVLGPLGASCLLVFAAHESPFSQPRHLVGGHLLSTTAALVILDIFGRSHLTIGVTLAFVLLLMAISKMMHPPAAASAIVAINTEAGWGFLLIIVLCALLLVAISLFYNNLFKERQYPKQWL
ncbi:HPP family protein [Anaerobacillus sp. MEB173]|uniref:HPP family protein n=1 Tax=Anaerobacillus sp. MEB173 TaxID=3383345 RepID=UPI003F8F5D16